MSKLVRDLIPEVIPEDKQNLFRFTVLDDAEYRKQLNLKLKEEVNEYLEAENIEELADILEVVDALIKLNNFDRKELNEMKEDKKKNRGGFEKRLLMENIAS